MGAAREAARTKYEEAYAKLREGLEYGFSHGGTSPLLSVAIPAFNAALAGLMLTGLDEYLAASAKDRESAAESRKSAEADRQADRAAAEADKRKQDSDRAAMNRFTMAIMIAAMASAFGTLYGAFRPSKPTVIPAPVVNITPIPVTLTLPSPAGTAQQRPKLRR